LSEKPLKIGITGISGRLGSLVAATLHRSHEVVGIDRRPANRVPEDIPVHCIDIRRKRCEAIFRKESFDVVIHLNMLHSPRAKSRDKYSTNIGGTSRVMAHCAKYGVKKLIFLSSANVYGPRPDNTQFLTEDAPLLGSEQFSELRALVGADMLAQSFFWKYPSVETVILRPVHILGEVRNAPSNYLRLEQPWCVTGYDPMLQVIHEADVANAILLALKPGVTGIFNLAGCTPCPLSRLLELAGCAPRRMPMPILSLALSRMWKMRLTTFPAQELDHLRFVCMVDDGLAKSSLGFIPEHDLIETLGHLRLTKLLDEA
jgi:UDP-glucose 4-epimerase